MKGDLEPAREPRGRGVGRACEGMVEGKGPKAKREAKEFRGKEGE